MGVRKGLFFVFSVLFLTGVALASHGLGHPECTNGVDDDGDGLADGADPGCQKPYSQDDNEGNSYDIDASWIFDGKSRSAVENGGISNLFAGYSTSAEGEQEVSGGQYYQDKVEGSNRISETYIPEPPGEGPNWGNPGADSSTNISRTDPISRTNEFGESHAYSSGTSSSEVGNAGELINAPHDSESQCGNRIFDTGEGHINCPQDIYLPDFRTSYKLYEPFSEQNFLEIKSIECIDGSSPNSTGVPSEITIVDGEDTVPGYSVDTGGENEIVSVTCEQGLEHVETFSYYDSTDTKTDESYSDESDTCEPNSSCSTTSCSSSSSEYTVYNKVDSTHDFTYDSRALEGQGVYSVEITGNSEEEDSYAYEEWVSTGTKTITDVSCSSGTEDCGDVGGGCDYSDDDKDEGNDYDINPSSTTDDLYQYVVEIEEEVIDTLDDEKWESNIEDELINNPGNGADTSVKWQPGEDGFLVGGGDDPSGNGNDASKSITYYDLVVGTWDGSDDEYLLGERIGSLVRDVDEDSGGFFRAITGTENLNPELSCPASYTCLAYIDAYESSDTWGNQKYNIQYASLDESLGVCKRYQHEAKSDDKQVDCMDFKQSQVCGDKAGEYTAYMEGPEINETKASSSIHYKACLDTNGEETVSNCVHLGDSVPEGSVREVNYNQNFVYEAGGYSPDMEVCLDLEGTGIGDEGDDVPGDQNDYDGDGENEDIGGEWYDLDSEVAQRYLRGVQDGTYSTTSGRDLVSSSSDEDSNGDGNYDKNDIDYYWRENNDPQNPKHNPQGNTKGTALEDDCGNTRFDTLNCNDAENSINRQPTFYSFFTKGKKDDDFHPQGENSGSNTLPNFTGTSNHVNDMSDQLEPGMHTSTFNMQTTSDTSTVTTWNDSIGTNSDQWATTPHLYSPTEEIIDLSTKAVYDQTWKQDSWCDS